MQSIRGRFSCTGALLIGLAIWLPPARAVVVNTSTDRMIPHIVDGGGWKTTFILVNLDARTIGFDLKFRDDNGAGLVLPFVQNRNLVRTDSLKGTIPAGDSAFTDTAGDDDPNTVQGTALLSVIPADAKLAGMVVFRQHVAGRPDFEAVVPISPFNENTLTLPFDNTRRASVTGGIEEFATGVALAVTIDPSATVGAVIGALARSAPRIAVLVKDTAGTVLAQDTLTFPIYGHRAFLISDRYPQSVGARGTVTFALQPGEATSVGLSGLGLRFNPSGAFTSFHTLSVR